MSTDAFAIDYTTWRYKDKQAIKRKLTANDLLSFCKTIFNNKYSNVYIGIDPGINPLTVCVLAGEKNHIFQFKLARQSDDWRDRWFRIQVISDALDAVLTAIGSNEKLRIMIEGYSFGSSGAQFTLAELKQSVLNVLYRFTHFEKVLLVPPPTWKSCLCPGQGTKGKEIIQACLEERYGVIKYFLKDHNKYDAFAMAILYKELEEGTLQSESAQKLRQRENIQNGRKQRRKAKPRKNATTVS